ncbi:MAG: tRNA (adenosine(37)-N6)-threonylcarbamoyltransferase complex dimerization subunit type 1 TsaB [Roseibacillus sp.]|nr:tRNA (adenosine(37)-N6)-threonylcarbamoyltransferase complex dimerization subunit type 1 TsaB [Roseibacillus sp.]
MEEACQIAIETSAPFGSVAAGRGGDIIFSAGFEAGRRPSELLLEPLQEALDHVGEGLVDLVLIGTGPGSYNGSRVGIAAGQGIAIVHRCPVVGISSLEALAEVRAGGPCLALGDARRETFFTLELCDGKAAGDPCLSDHLEFRKRVDAAADCGWTLVSLEEPGRLDLPGRDVRRGTPSAGLLLEAWRMRSEEERQELLGVVPEPFYLRPPHITESK